MAKVQGKKASAARAGRATRKAASRVKAAVRSTTKRVTKRAAAAARPVKKAVKPAARKLVAVAKVKAAVKKKGSAVTKPTAVLPARAAAPVAPKVPHAPKPVDAKKPRLRRPRPRVQSNGAPVAAWLPQGEKPRPSSFIPAPARAEAPSLIAAPPASSDRLIRPEDVTEFVTRTVPIRVDIEQSGGRVYIGVNPEEVVLRAGEGIEWDFRYFGGADVTCDEIVIEFEKPSPFANASFRSRKPGAARPHRQLSGAAQKTSAGTRVRYTIKAMTAFKTELATAGPRVSIA
jgi:hypothetical protein